ncbi:MAG TPA: hypothetical protein VGC95_05770, partial [Chitinophagaceae bacterium]
MIALLFVPIMLQFSMSSPLAEVAYTASSPALRKSQFVKTKPVVEPTLIIRPLHPLKVMLSNF